MKKPKLKICANLFDPLNPCSIGDGGKLFKFNIRFFTILVLSFISFSPSIFATELIYFYEKGCPECRRIDDFLQKRIKPNYAVVIKKFEIHKPGTANVLMDLARDYDAEDILKKGTPAIFVGDSAFHGSSRAVQRKIEQVVRSAIRSGAVSPLNRIQKLKRGKSITSQLTLPAVIGAAAVDAINPCACAVLVLLLGTILLASNRKRGAILGAGFAFTAACFIAYFLMGLGLFTAVRVAAIEHNVYIAVAILAILIGLWNMKDYFTSGRWFSIEVPKSWQPKLKRITSNITSVPGAFGMGLVISLFLLPCTSGPYIVIVGMLSNVATRLQAIWLLLLYNVIFMLPFVIITLVVGLGFTTTARVEMWRQQRLPQFRFITGVVMFVLGVIMGVLVVLGVI